MNLVQSVVAVLVFGYVVWWLLFRKLEYKHPPKPDGFFDGRSDKTYRVGLLGGLLGGQVKDLALARYALQHAEQAALAEDSKALTTAVDPSPIPASSPSSIRSRTP